MNELVITLRSNNKYAILLQDIHLYTQEGITALSYHIKESLNMDEVVVMSAGGVDVFVRDDKVSLEYTASIHEIEYEYCQFMSMLMYTLYKRINYVKKVGHTGQT